MFSNSFNWFFFIVLSIFIPQVGDSVPNVDLFEGAPDGKVNLAEVCKEGKVIIFGVPGAFTPGCSKTHLPGNFKSFNLMTRQYEQLNAQISKS